MKTKKIKEGASEKEKVDKMTRRREIHHGTKQIGTLLWFWLGMHSRFWRTRSSQFVHAYIRMLWEHPVDCQKCMKA